MQGEWFVKKKIIDNVVMLPFFFSLKYVCSGEKDMILLGIFHTSMDLSEMIHLKGADRPEQKERTRSRCIHTVRAKRVCRKTFRYLHS